MAVDRSAPDAVSGMTNKEIDAKIVAAKAEGHAAGLIEGKAHADTSAKATTEAAVSAAKVEATKAASDRVKSVMALDETKGRESAALSLALTTDLSAEALKPTLAALPKASAAEGARSQDNPLGITLGNANDKKTNASDAYTPEEVAARINKK